MAVDEVTRVPAVGDGGGLDDGGAVDLTALETLLADPEFHLAGREPDKELRESMAANGWLPDFPAIQDGAGNVISGHRRIAVAKELGITPVWKLSSSATTPSERIQLALASNVGGKPWTRAQRQTIAKHLYGEKSWTLAKIAQALKVSVPTVSRDLAGEGISPEKAHPERGGRPKGEQPPKAQAEPRLVEVFDERSPIDALRLDLAKLQARRTLVEGKAPRTPEEERLREDELLDVARRIADVEARITEFEGTPTVPEAVLAPGWVGDLEAVLETHKRIPALPVDTPDATIARVTDLVDGVERLARRIKDKADGVYRARAPHGQTSLLDEAA